MKYTEGRTGRVFVLRLEDGEIVHEVIEAFALAKSISAASVTAVGGVSGNSTLVVGPRDGNARPIDPMTMPPPGVSEITGTGTIFPDERGQPVVHMHMACGREDRTFTGCIRRGVRVWATLEVVITELDGCQARRIPDESLGFSVLIPGDGGPQ